MWNPFTKKKTKIVAPVAGKVINIKKVKDEAFSSGAMGEGFGIEFEGKNVVSPVDGTVEMCFPTGHAIGIKTATGTEVIVHIGIDTVELNGDGFHLCTEQGKKVKRGDLLVEVDSTYIKNKGFDPVTIVVFPTQEKITLLSDEKIVNANDEVAEC